VTEADAWNAFLAALPSRQDWDEWLAETAAQTLSRAAGSKPKLTVSKVIESDEAPVEHLLEAERTVLGRDAECDIILPEKVITKKHAAITVRDGRYFLEDLGSAMGVFRRHKQLSPHEPVELDADDEFSIFPYSFRFKVESLWAAESDVSLGAARTAVETWKNFLGSAGPSVLLFGLRVEPVGREVFVQVEAGLASDLVNGMLPALDGKAEAAGRLDVDRALLEVWLLALLDGLGDRLGGELQVSLAGSIASDAAWPLMRGACVSAGLRIRGRSRGLRLFLPFQTLERLSYQASPHPEADAAISWRCRVSVAAETYAAEDLAQLEPGDVLLPAERLRLHLPGEAGAWRCSAEDAAFASIRLEKYQVTELDVSGQAPSAESLDELPVQLEVVVGDKRLTMAEIRELGEGSVIALDRALDAPVELWANGVRAGRGELVEIDGKLGVKVTEWLRKS
jgi:type III secretion system YscQ/HrcQ family protein